MLNCSASLSMSTSILKDLPGKFDIKRHPPSILYLVVLMRIKLSNRKELYEDIKRSLRKIVVGIMEESVRQNQLQL